MKLSQIIVVAIIAVSAGEFEQRQLEAIAPKGPGEELIGNNGLTLKPDFGHAGLSEHGVTIPFEVKNTSTGDIRITAMQKMIEGLAILDRAGGLHFLGDKFRPDGLPEGSVTRSGFPHAEILKPGMSSVFYTLYDRKTLGLFLNVKVFGVIIDARVIKTGSDFVSFSEPFKIPQALIMPPWTDLGEQTYFSVSPDITRPGDRGDHLLIPTTIKNTSSQDLIAATDDLVFLRVNDEGRKRALRPWEYWKASGPLLKPGESAESTGRGYITLSELMRNGYKPGDKIVAVVGGRIPNTSKIFECYSAPFDLPALPK